MINDNLCGNLTGLGERGGSSTRLGLISRVQKKAPREVGAKLEEQKQASNLPAYFIKLTGIV